MKALNFIPVFILTGFVGGILIGNTFNGLPELIFDFKFYFFFIVVSLLLLNKYLHSYLGLTSTLMVLILSGILSLYYNDPTNHNQFYSNIPNFDTNQTQQIIFEPIKRLKPSDKFEKLIIKINQLNNNTCKGKALLYIPISKHKNQPLAYGNLYMVHTKLNSISKPNNPYQFDYKKYMERQSIYYSAALKKDQDYTLVGKIKNVNQYAGYLRKVLIKNINEGNLNASSKALIHAIILGQRQDIDPKTYSSYVNSGAVHLLAVSGLHVGMITLIFGFILMPLERIKHGKLIAKFFLILLLWCYALITGGSASVCRAVTMFSFLILGTLIKRPTKTINNLAVSALLLLIINPNFIFDVGFQLSYLAVLGIVIIHPMLNKLIKPKYKILKYFWTLVTVSLSAQIAVFPLTIYYFKQFPGLFLITNILLIPIMGLVIIIGLLLLVFTAPNSKLTILEKGFQLLNEYITHIVQWVGDQKRFIINPIQIDSYETFLIYCIIVLSIMYFKTKLKSTITIICLTIIGFQLKIIYDMHTNKTNELVVFHEYKDTILARNYNRHITISSKKPYPKSSFSTNNYLTQFNKYDTVSLPLTHFYPLKKSYLMVIQDHVLPKQVNQKAEVILLSGSPKINLERLISIYKPKLIISDGSNYSSYVNRWKKTCKKTRTPFHNTYEKGAKIFKL